MSYEFKNGKYIFNRDGVYFALTAKQVAEMKALCIFILADITYEAKSS